MKGTDSMIDDRTDYLEQEEEVRRSREQLEEEE